jgi:hypothetical protein
MASPRPPGLSAYPALPSRHSDLNHVIRLMVALGSVASAPPVVPGFAINEQARHKTPPKQVRHPTDCRFTSGCSPPHLTVTQLPSISGTATIPDTDLHHADKASSRDALITGLDPVICTSTGPREITGSSPVMTRRDRPFDSSIVGRRLIADPVRVGTLTSSLSPAERWSKADHVVPASHCDRISGLGFR